MVLPLPNVEKKRASTSKSKKHYIKDALLKPTTWKAAAAALDFGLKVVRVGAKVWDMFS